MMILDKIVAAKWLRLEKQKQHMPIEALMERVRAMPQRESSVFENALKRDGLSIIAEVKKASPSKGVISEDFHPVEIAREYESCGADAVSVLTEEDFFMGSGEYLTEIGKAVALPLLRKDFLFDIWQVYESRLLGAHAILLIAGILSAEQMRTFQDAASRLGMDALVEAHDEGELEKALNAGVKIVGINNRDLKTFDVSLKTTERLLGMVPSGVITVSESGIFTADDAQFVYDLGADAVLVGESLMRAGDVKAQLSALKAAGRQ